VVNADVERIVEDLSALVAIPSVTGSERRGQEHMASLLEEATLEVEWIEADADQLGDHPDFPGIEVPRTDLPVVIGRHSSGRPGPTRMLLGHIDVVPTGDPASWTSPPFSPQVRDGLLYGRGACDMKGGMVSMLEAVRLVLESGEEMDGDLLVVSVPSEEDGGAGTFAALQAGVTADMAVIAEPTGLDLVIAHAGAITFTLGVPGKAAHASMRTEGVSALEKLGVLMEALARDEEQRNRAETDPRMRALGLPYPTVIGVIEGGSWPSTVMDRVEVDGRYGVRLGQDGIGAAADLRSAVTTAWMADEWLSRFPVDLEVWGGRFDSSSVAEDHPLPSSLSATHHRRVGSGPALVGVPYGADMRLLINHGGIPTVMYGPGDVRVAHSADEHVRIDEVALCAEVLAGWLLAG
jgi:acetylornithine deacetylase